MKQVGEMQEAFLKALKTIPVEFSELKQIPAYRSVLVYVMGNENNTNPLGNIFSKGIELIETDNPEAARYFLVVSEIPNLNRNVRGLCLDVMIFAEGDLHGRFSSRDGVIAELKKIAASH